MEDLNPATYYHILETSGLPTVGKLFVFVPLLFHYHITPCTEKGP